MTETGAILIGLLIGIVVFFILVLLNYVYTNLKEKIELRFEKEHTEIKRYKEVLSNEIESLDRRIDGIEYQIEMLCNED